MAVNCASIAESLIEAEHFGVADGAFTGAQGEGAPGCIVQANGGTLFLDEIGDLPQALQARLLRVLQERSVRPLGGANAIAVDIAVIGATRRDLREMINRHEFREDLYYRLNGLALRLPPLREHSDLEVVARRILLAHRPTDPPDISPQVMDLFRRYAWPGNIRQLANVLRTAAVLSAGERSITTAHLSDDLLEEVQAVGPPANLHQAEPVLARTLRTSESELIRRTLQSLGGNVTAASRQLGISRNTIYRKLHGKVEG